MAGQPLLFCCGCRCGPALHRCPAPPPRLCLPAGHRCMPRRSSAVHAPLVGGDRCRFLFLLFLIEFCHRCVRVCDGEKLTVATAVSRELGLSFGEGNCRSMWGDSSRAHRSSLYFLCTYV